MHDLGPRNLGAFDGARYVAILLEQGRLELHRLCMRWARGHRADADDLLAEASLRALRATRRVAAPLENPIGWLATIVRNVARDRLRAPRRAQWAHAAAQTWCASAPDALESIVTKELLTRAAAELRRLPATQRRSLLARAAGDDYASIAAILGTSPQNARKLVQSARSTLRGRLGLGAPRLQAT